jgi:Cd2+/Zn2+-exporting ATPase
MGNDLAMESAPVALMTNNLRKIPWLIDHSRRTNRIIHANIALSLLLKLFFVVLAIPGWATLWMAVLADSGAALLVIANSLRLLKQRHE